MKITKTQLKQIIKEELSRLIETPEDDEATIVELLGHLEIVAGRGDARGVLELMGQLAVFETDGRVLEDALSVIFASGHSGDLAAQQMSNREDM